MTNHDAIPVIGKMKQSQNTTCVIMVFTALQYRNKTVFSYVVHTDCTHDSITVYIKYHNPANESILHTGVDSAGGEGTPCQIFSLLHRGEKLG